ncbi:hypothetical protein [Acidaminococcus timonensis]|uniref:hypothetical protein n=1 Tax=Acidaminococcus timonensis TaxID=1871002 RepID=UPI002943E985|nr:hypothetical protein [Acidaminococcus timonensis]
MKAKELDCIKLKDGREGCIMMEFPDGAYLVEIDGLPDIGDNIIVHPDEIEKITYVA